MNESVKEGSFDHAQTSKDLEYLKCNRIESSSQEMVIPQELTQVLHGRNMSGELAKGWEKHFDGEGTPFYVNVETGESQWDAPEIQHYERNMSGELAEGWQKHFDGEGTPYYVNVETGECQWDAPEIQHSKRNMSGELAEG